jgi:protein-S-isoprenylcysteine O-methyltransferase Ste14
MYRVLLAVAWLFGVAYSQVPTFWFMAHPLAERWRASRRSPYRVLVPVWLAGILGVLALTWRWREAVFYETPWTMIPGIALTLLGIFLYRAAFKGFTSQQLFGRSELQPGHEQRLVTSGIRNRIRHPVYLAYLCELFGFAIASGLVVLYIAMAYALLADALMIRLEDSELERRFGAEYRDYRLRVPAMFPRLSRRTNSGAKVEAA